jgi:hypothetical protein
VGSRTLGSCAARAAKARGAETRGREAQLAQVVRAEAETARPSLSASAWRDADVGHGAQGPEADERWSALGARVRDREERVASEATHVVRLQTGGGRKD